MPEQILVVDDDPALLQVLTRFLQGQGFAVEAHQRGGTALAAVEQQEPAVAILDLNLPDLSGLEVMRRLKATRPDTEVILFTGLGGLDSAVAALRLGAYDYLVKSELKLPELAAVVERALERRHLTRANRELVEDLKQAREALAQRRAQELVQIRRIGERLAGPLTLEGLTQGLADLIWESLPLACLSLVLTGPEGERWGEAHRRRPELSPEAQAAWQGWLAHCLACPADPPSEAPCGWALMREEMAADGHRGLAAGGRPEPFEREEAELFRIFLLQGEAALRNLLLFEEVKSLAIRDGLTGLYNYRYFHEMLTQQVGQSRRYGWPLSLLFLDLDDFKVVNDTLGHPAGDVVLKSVADYLKRSVRQADILCRYGGEEFVMLLPQTPPEQAAVLAERLRAGIAGLRIPLPERELTVTVSIGVAGLPPHTDGAGLVEAADRALYRAKEGGKNRVCR
ncbi:MAG: diguanylate cyclase [Syntrophobacterales bacterium]|nr:diguanylate cyclase [Syntrophobacterales bacterium]